MKRTLQDRLKRQRAYVERKLGTAIICDRCRCTLDTFAEKCPAELTNLCAGFLAIEAARQEFDAGIPMNPDKALEAARYYGEEAEDALTCFRCAIKLRAELATLKTHSREQAETVEELNGEIARLKGEFDYWHGIGQAMGIRMFEAEKALRSIALNHAEPARSGVVAALKALDGHVENTQRAEAAKAWEEFRALSVRGGAALKAKDAEIAEHVKCISELTAQLEESRLCAERRRTAANNAQMALARMRELCVDLLDECRNGISSKLMDRIADAETALASLPASGLADAVRAVVEGWEEIEHLNALAAAWRKP